MKTADEIRQAVIEVLTKTLGREIHPDETFVSSGLIDSLMILRLITQIESKLGARIATATIQPDDFDTVEYAVETIERTLTP
jgi:acyl carrier protein